MCRNYQCTISTRTVDFEQVTLRGQRQEVQSENFIASSVHVVKARPSSHLNRLSKQGLLIYTLNPGISENGS